MGFITGRIKQILPNQPMVCAGELKTLTLQALITERGICSR